MKNGTFDLILPTQQVLEQLVLDSHFTFAPGLLDAAHSKKPPTISYFKSLPLNAVKAWAVYLLVLEKADHQPNIYIGSATQQKGRSYADGSIQKRTVHTCVCPARFQQRIQKFSQRPSLLSLTPNCFKIFELRGVFLLLETALSLFFWAMVSRTKDYCMPHLCPWALDTMEYHGCCNHLSLNEYIHG